MWHLTQQSWQQCLSLLVQFCSTLTVSFSKYLYLFYRVVISFHWWIQLELDFEVQSLTGVVEMLEFSYCITKSKIKVSMFYFNQTNKFPFPLWVSSDKFWSNQEQIELTRQNTTTVIISQWMWSKTTFTIAKPFLIVSPKSTTCKLISFSSSFQTTNFAFGTDYNTMRITYALHSRTMYCVWFFSVVQCLFSLFSNKLYSTVKSHKLNEIKWKRLYRIL